MNQTDRPWSTQPVTGAQHDAWMAQERTNSEQKIVRHATPFLIDYEFDHAGLACLQCGTLAYAHEELR